MRLFKPKQPKPYEFIMNWADEAYNLQTEPEIHGQRKKRMYPVFNPLHGQVVPGEGPEQDIYFDLLARAIIPNTRTTHYECTRALRRILAMLARVLVSRIYDYSRESQDPYQKIPDVYQGQDPTLAMLADWIIGVPHASTQPQRWLSYESPAGILDILGEAEKYNWQKPILDDLKWVLSLPDELRIFYFTQLKHNHVEKLNLIQVPIRHMHDPFRFYPEDLRGLLTQDCIQRHAEEFFPEHESSLEKPDKKNHPYPENHPRAPQSFANLSEHAKNNLSWRPVRVWLMPDYTGNEAGICYGTMNRIFQDLCEYRISRRLPGEWIQQQGGGFLPMGPYPPDIRVISKSPDSSSRVFQNENYRE